MKTFLVWLLGLRACTVGPGEIAIADQSLWPSPIVSRASFDEASRAEILVFLRAYGDGVAPDETAAPVRAWRARSARLFLHSYLDAARSCPGLGCGFRGTTFPELLEFARTFPATLPPEYARWLAMSEKFFTVYVAEQTRLAALFPDPTSEILPLSDAEIFGDRFRDGEFLLTFDDGPTPAGGNTDATASAARSAGVAATFFALGSMLELRLAAGPVKDLYEGQCLGSHGWEHKSHQRWEGWKESLHRTFRQIQAVFPGVPVAFRPPYGQRTPEVNAEQSRLAGAPTVMWNIDSQDWNDLMPADKVADRLQKLMLVWRRGVILMHDVHPKAAVALPGLTRFARAGRLTWVDCHTVR